MINFQKLVQDMEPDLKLVLIAQVDHKPPLDKEEDFFEIGLARMHGFIKEDRLELTKTGEDALIELLKEQIEEEDLDDEYLK